jgi:hypothetical protein
MSSLTDNLIQNNRTLAELERTALEAIAAYETLAAQTRQLVKANQDSIVAQIGLVRIGRIDAVMLASVDVRQAGRFRQQVRELAREMAYTERAGEVAA